MLNTTTTRMTQFDPILKMRFTDGRCEKRTNWCEGAYYVTPNVLRMKIPLKKQQVNIIHTKKEAETEECIACFENKPLIKMLPCNHSLLCTVCIKDGLRTTTCKRPLCPTCRRSVTAIQHSDGAVLPVS